MAKENDSTDELLANGFWFVLAFVLLMILFFVVQPIFFWDLIEPFWRLIAQHQGLDEVVGFFSGVYRDFGFFLVFALVVIFAWVYFLRKKEPAQA